MKVSFLMITLDRFDITPRVWKTNMANAKVGLQHDVEIESIIGDNGSTDKRIVDYFDVPGIHYHRKNKTNEGVGHCFTQLFLRSTGDYICLLGNDIEMSPGWLAKAIEYSKNISNCGIIGFPWCDNHVPPLSEKFGINAHFLTPTLNRVFGTWFLSRSLIEDLGFFYEGFNGYGLEDSCYNERVNRSGYNSFYLPNCKSTHICNDVGETSEYRQMKNEYMGKNLTVFGQRIEYFNSGGSLKTYLPKMRGVV